MSRRREQIERSVEREENRLEKRLQTGAISREQYDQEMKDLMEEEQEAYLDARDQDFEDLRNDWDRW